MTLFGECPGSERIRKPYPEEIRCCCGETVEIWSDEVSALCKKCDKKITRDMLPSCLDWCAMAKDCVGHEKYKRYLESKKRRI